MCKCGNVPMCKFATLHLLTNLFALKTRFPALTLLYPSPLHHAIDSLPMVALG